MELISKISKGTKMDQIYIPKNRPGFHTGEYVKIIPVNERPKDNYYVYNIKEVPPIKIEIAKQIFQIIESMINYDNIIITGSFLDENFKFNDIDIIIITENKKEIEKSIKEKLKIEVHTILFNQSLLIEALKIDPKWRLMLSRCISKKRIAPLPQRKLKYRYLDVQLIESKTLMINFNYLTGKEKYKLTRNMMAISMFIKNKNISNKSIEKEIEKELDTNIEDLKNNLVTNDFFKRYKTFYSKLEKEIIENASKQEKDA